MVAGMNLVVLHYTFSNTKVCGINFLGLEGEPGLGSDEQRSSHGTLLNLLQSTLSIHGIFHLLGLK
jgi:hypothetical protein